ncbi:anthranilate synthase component I family protein [Aestuariimicrobium sp. T2.26MG-19.2B]|uniref:anthranilate synthase component I family protein n=1 Tax=Aestuariimicrobium sp. T2.26MG-19.2B TaxID=3040679 RepID=UPI002477C859|nr:anthranilate synthase component I family protein [Aestuariimicrobium sp. T2.26MG-19.2B]CAI9400225.1 Isochorismate synthase MenF [Aestuariimicrobium sp. T2.26MG-19.2B]
MAGSHAGSFGWLTSGWSAPHPSLDPAALAAHWWSDASQDVVWLDSSDGGAHLVGVGGMSLLAPDFDSFEAVMRDSDEAWVGWIGYEAGSELLGLSRGESPRHPPISLVRLSRWAVIEADGSTTLHAAIDEQAWALPDTLPPVDEPPAMAAGSLPTGTEGVSVLAGDSDEELLAAIDRCIEHIRAGDALVLCLTTTLWTDSPIDAFASHLRLRRSSPVPHGGLLRINGTVLSSASMETFLRVHDGIATTSPIKGTRRRDPDPEVDLALAEELAASEKERAENLMIVDLCRNDLGRICRPGSVQVDELFSVRGYASVHQLVSTVSGQLREDLGPVDALRALFPAGSMTGAPKRRAVEILRELESWPRGIYSGCFGIFTGQHCEAAMVIRSVVSDEDAAWIGVGAGITALSVAHEELDEMHLKAAALVDCLVR